MDVYDSDDNNTKIIDGASVALTDSWVQYSAAAISATNTGECRVLLTALDGGTTGDIGVDDITIVQAGTTYTEDLEHMRVSGRYSLGTWFKGSGGGGGTTGAQGFIVID